MNQKLSFATLGFLCGILSASLLFAFVSKSSDGNVQQTRVLKLAHGLDSSHPVHTAMVYMKKRVEELSDGTLTLDIRSGGVLGSEPQCMEQIKNGSLDMGKNSSSPMSIFIPELQALTLPYLYRNSDHFWKVLDSDIGKSIMDNMEKYGFIGLCYYDAGARSFYNSKRPIKKPEDLEGMKIRVLNSRLDIETIHALGAAPTVISAGETYTSIAQGVVDGAENNPPTYETSAHWECAKYYSLDEHTRIPDILYIGAKTWATLTPKQRDILKTAAQDSSIYQRKLWKEKSDECLKDLKNKGVIINTVDKSPFVKKTESVYKQFDGTKIGKIVEEIKALK